MKILVLTRNHPVQILDVLNRIFTTVFNNNLEEGLCISPQATALMVEEVKGIPYRTAYYPALKVFEQQKEELSLKAPHMVVIGTVPVDSYAWYDAVVGLDDAESIKDYNDFDEDFNTEHYKTLTLKDSDCIFNHFDELRYFLTKIIKITGEKK